ncbi:ectonucleotide pyrophosphatase/phosphodiesterase [Aureivirga sp. CE67]|uniref:alkaline phosphatase family protein n=1 Tax=Aureivirga sp. CE67 TaxID=1788983 RepID=UPI0018C9B81B|nr:ectonucleotide pyrophosphatase/phosphodiesterase [Aureivirga sp. CE67]
MKIKTTFLLSFFAITFSFFACSKDDSSPSSQNPDPKPPYEKQHVILVSVDGFRFDYTDKINTPNFDRIVNEGMKAERLIPVFPSKTFPNHLSLVTGQHPENHGIIMNTFYDENGDKYSISSDAVKDPKWYLGEPIWVTAEKQNVKAATYFWPGSEAPIQGVRPSIWKEYNGNIANTTRVDTALDWLDLPEEERPQFISLYFSIVDSAGHKYGPNSDEVKNTISQIDFLLGRLYDGIKEHELAENVQLIIVSDHGMSELSRDRAVFYDDYIDTDEVSFNSNYTPVGTITVNDPAKKMEIYNQLKDANPHMDVYLKEEVPERLHYSNHPYIADIITVAEEGWTMSTRSFFENNPNSANGTGTHGYDPFKGEDMHGIFIANGTKFKKENIDSFNTVDLYELMCSIIGIEPSSNDGDKEKALEVLK